MNGDIPKNTFLTTVAFVGRPNVGKSTLLNALVGTKISPTTRKPQTTRRTIRGIVTDKEHQMIFIDTPGVLKKTGGLNQFMYAQIFKTIDGVNQVVTIVDATDEPIRHIEFLTHVKSKTKKNQQPLILALNKIDQINDKSQLLEKIAFYSKEIEFDGIVPISAEKHDGLADLINEIKKGAEPSPFLFSEEFFTDASEKEIVAELIREKAMLELKDELPYKIAVTVEEFDESKREEEKKPLINILATLHVERKSQKGIVVGKAGDTIKTIGIRARQEIERLLQCQVMLRLIVRVEPNWTTSPRALRKLGY